MANGPQGAKVARPRGFFTLCFIIVRPRFSQVGNTRSLSKLRHIPPDPNPVTPSCMRLRIYLVEDSPVIRDSLAESLEELARARIVGWASKESEAVQWLNENKASWDLAIVDLFLLEGSGLGVVMNCRERDLRQKVIVLTNYATPAVRERCLAIGADAVFDKSNEIDEFTRYALEEVERAAGSTQW